MSKHRIVRLQAPVPLLEQIDAVAAQMTSANLGGRVTRSEVIRAACLEYVARRATRCTVSEGTRS